MSDYEMFSDVWRFFKKYREVSDTDEYWEEVVEESKKIFEKYKKALCKDLLLSVLSELERRTKK